MFGPDVKAVDVVQHPVVGLGHDRVGEEKLPAVANLPVDRGIANHADAMGVREEDRALEESGLADPGRAGHLAVAVQRKPGGEHRIE